MQNGLLLLEGLLVTQVDVKYLLEIALEAVRVQHLESGPVKLHYIVLMYVWIVHVEAL